MQNIKNTTPPPIKIIPIEVELPEDFITICNFFNLNATQAIEAYLAHITVFNFLFDESEGFNFEATQICKKFIKLHFNIENVKLAAHYELHQEPIRHIVKLGIQGKKSTSEAYLNIIDNWHKSLPKPL